MAAWYSSGGPERALTLVTFPSASISASTCTFPEIFRDFAKGGYTGDTDRMTWAGFTSPPTTRGASGALGCLPAITGNPLLQKPLLGAWPLLKPLEPAASGLPPISGAGSPAELTLAPFLTLGAAARALLRIPESDFFA